jgi:hypothetical protein
MNNQNVAVGWRTSGNCVSGLDITYAFVWDAGRLVEIDPVPFGRDSAQATDVSETGVVAGYFGAQSIATGLAYRRADVNRWLSVLLLWVVLFVHGGVRRRVT